MGGLILGRLSREGGRRDIRKITNGGLFNATRETPGGAGQEEILDRIVNEGRRKRF